MLRVSLLPLARLSIPRPAIYCFVAHDDSVTPRYFARSDLAWHVWHWPPRRLRAYLWRIFEHGTEPIRPAAQVLPSPERP